MENNNEEKSSLEDLQNRLDSRSFSPVKDYRSKISNSNIEDVDDDWSTESKDSLSSNIALNEMTRKEKNYLKKFLIISIIFFIIALGGALFVVFDGTNIISSDNVEISVTGPNIINGGEVLSLDILIKNNNNTTLELADLIVEYPEGARSPNNLSKELLRERFSMGNIGSGDKADQEINVVLFGEEGTKEKIILTLEYRVAGSNAIFHKEKEYEVEISSSPVSLKIDSLSDVNSGKEITLNITLKSNSNTTIEDLMFVAEYPFGFSFKEATPRTSYDQNIWRIGDLSPNEERKIKIRGVIEGQDGEERIFRFFSGLQSDDNERELKTAFISATKSISINKPFLSLDILVDGSRSDNYSSSLNKTANVEIFWQNNLPTNVANVEIEAVLSGDYEESTVFVERGFYNSKDNTITWNQGTNSLFDSVAPGEDGSVSFRFNPRPFTSSSYKNPEVTMNVNVRGRRLSESSVSEEVLSSAKKSIRFNTELSLLPRITHFSGPITNSGPIPPKAEVETTYTVIWTLSNNVSDASNVLVSARLPSYVRWTNNISPLSENLTYNPVSREVTWDVRDIKALSGFTLSPREIAFQISLLPSVSQVGQAPVLIERARVTGIDDFTGVTLDSSMAELTTSFQTDSGYKFGDETVKN